MTEEAALALQPGSFSPGRTLSTSLGVLGRNFVPFLIITLIISLPYIAIQTWLDILSAQAAATPRGEPGSLTSANYAMVWVQIITFALVQAALTYGTVQDLHGRRASIGDCFGKGLGRSGSIVGGAVKYGFLLGLATLLLIIPGLLLYLRWWVFIPAMVVEDLGSSAAFARSKALTSGRRWAIFGLVALIFVVEMAAIFGSAIVVNDGVTMSIVVTLIAVLFTTVSSVVAAVGYYHLRVEKEGVLIEDIAAVFD